MKQPPLHIVLAEDDENDRMNFVEALGESKINTMIHTVNDGVELMEYLSAKNVVLPELIFLDLNLPRKNGLLCLKEIRTTPTLKTVAIAIYSTSSSEQDINDTFMEGANVYIKKPNDFTVLKKSLDRVVRSAEMYRNPPFNISNFLLKI